MKSWMKFSLLLSVSCLVMILSACDPPPNCVDPYTVTKTDDTNDGLCSTGDCSLREAVLNANACPGTQIINLPAGSYALTIDGDDEDMGETGDLDVTDDLIIIGTGAPSINGNIERAFHIHNGVTADFSLVWLTDGDAIYGGGLVNEGDLTLSAFTCNYNSVSIPMNAMGDAMGGCIFNTGNLTISGGQFLGNTAGYGGAIYNYENSTATLENINFYENEADTNGGAIWIGVDAEVTNDWSTYDGNLAGLDGGAIWNHGDFDGYGLAFLGNESAHQGGAVYSWMDSFTLFSNTRLSENISAAGGAIFNNNGMMHLYETGLSDNVASGPVGGGIYNNGPVPSGGLLLKNVTVSNNTALGGVGGGGIYNTGNFDFSFITIAENDPDGLRIDTGSEIKLRSSIIADNAVSDCAGTPPDSLNFNIDGDGSCGLTAIQDLSATDPLLEPLGPHGGMGLSHPLGPGSPAIDSGTPDMCIAQDQNGVSRPQGALCDRGAFEVPTPGGSISGIAWHDLCAIPYSPPAETPPGCVELSGGSYAANGIYEPGEPGLEGVQVKLFIGSCPADPMAVNIPVLTDINGEYSFQDLSDATYCVMVDALELPSEAILIPGGWTYPPGGNPAQTEVTISGGEAVTDINFGWDYQFLPSPGGSVSGKVWHDLCAVPDETPPSPPEGCVDLGGGSLGANGILEPGEPGIEGVNLHLFTGGCPFDPVASSILAITNSSGEYSIGGVSPGTYCAVIYTGEIPNDTILIPGSWTYPPGGSDHIEYEVTILGDEAITDINFGWDYEFLPSPDAPDAPSNFGIIDKNTFCRLGPGTIYEKVTSYPPETKFEILARSERQLPLWLYIEEVIQKIRCWISADLATFEMDPNLIPTKIVPLPPTATPTPPVQCNPKMDQEACENAGGYWFVGGAGAVCICP